MAKQIIAIASNELRKFTKIVLDSRLGIDINEEKLTSDDAYDAVNYLQKVKGKDLYKGWFGRAFSGGSGMQGVINDLNNEAAEPIREVIYSGGNSLPANASVDTWGSGTRDAARILRLSK